MRLRVMKISKIKPLDEILKMSKKELLHYLKESEISMQKTDSVEVKPFKHGTKILFYHKNQNKPYKTRVYLTAIDYLENLK